MHRSEIIMRIGRAARERRVPWAMVRQGRRTRNLAVRRLDRCDAKASRNQRPDRSPHLSQPAGGTRGGVVAMTRRRFTAKAVKSGRWWAIEVPELGNVFSQSRRLDQAEMMARDAIALMLEVPPDSFDVVLEPDLGSLGDLRVSIEASRLRRREAAEAQNAASRTTLDAVTRLRASGLTSRDVGTLLGVSVQRVSQVERKASM
jgi:predicted RNase H-like HicB family nuclease